MNFYDFEAKLEEKCRRITCGRRPTSCAEQLVRAVRAAYESTI